ncbi:shikimate dehydrogenase [Legionella lytica]|uniref:Shikimate dehydrogenase (NADP(+)) n=1 Tax=Legionella lytica TaxID=96232 RepID=A0ABY4Y7T3_9GAMM|nr:shikimate dehydrogenase [Legionella lytica]USQ13506.1 shikimate dehydrogenase [Legionella lytica]
MFQRFAVMGNPIDHSLSPVIHQYFAKQAGIQLTYAKIKADEQSFEQQLTNFFHQQGRGVNVTLPFKQRAFMMAQQTTERCKLAGAANTLWMNDNQLHADNTDGVGLIRDLHHYINLPGKRVAILGAGGAARGIIHPLLQNKLAELVIVNRTQAKGIELQQLFPQIQVQSINQLNGVFDLIINATSASLAGQLPSLPLECLTTKPLCYDLSYQKQEDTAFVYYAKECGCEAVDGLGMLVEQAAEAFLIWHGFKPETQTVLEYLRM